MLARMRTFVAAINYIKEKDPGSCITKHFLYTEARAGRLPGVVKAGNRYLINIDALEEYLANGVCCNISESKPTTPIYGQLRKVNA